jgi:hypothetical protein
MGTLLDRELTSSEQFFVDSLLLVIPPGFVQTVPEGKIRNIKILGIAALALGDYNNKPPRQNLTLANAAGNPLMLPLIEFGSLLYASFLKQNEYSLIDIDYSDQGFSLRVDRVGKIGASIEVMERNWLRMVDNAKKNVTLDIASFGVSLSSPRFQSNLARFLSILPGTSASGWQIP